MRKDIVVISPVHGRLVWDGSTSTWRGTEDMLLFARQAELDLPTWRHYPYRALEVAHIVERDSNGSIVKVPNLTSKPGLLYSGMRLRRAL